MPLVALHDELVRATDQLNVVRQVEFLHDVTAEEVAGAARTDTPAGAVCTANASQRVMQYLSTSNIGMQFILGRKLNCIFRFLSKFLKTPDV